MYCLTLNGKFSAESPWPEYYDCAYPASYQDVRSWLPLRVESPSDRVDETFEQETNFFQLGRPAGFAVVVIRRARLEDSSSLRDLLQSMLSEDERWIRHNATNLGKEAKWIRGMIKDHAVHSTNPSKFMFFAFQGDKLVGHVNGMVWVHLAKDGLEEKVKEYGLKGGAPGHVGIGVHKDFRRKGIGTKLMDRALQEFVRMGVTDVFATVDLGNKASVSFFEKMGFSTVRKGNRQLVMSLDLFHFDLA